MVALSRPWNGRQPQVVGGDVAVLQREEHRQPLAIQQRPDLAQAVRAALGGQGVLHLLEADQARAGEDPVGGAAPAALAAGAGAEPVQGGRARRAHPARLTAPARIPGCPPPPRSARSASDRAAGGRRRQRRGGTMSRVLVSATSVWGNQQELEVAVLGGLPGQSRPGIPPGASCAGPRAGGRPGAAASAPASPHPGSPATPPPPGSARPSRSRSRVNVSPLASTRSSASARLATQPSRVPVPWVAVASTPPSDWASTSPWFSSARPSAASSGPRSRRRVPARMVACWRSRSTDTRPARPSSWSVCWSVAASGVKECPAPSTRMGCGRSRARAATSSSSLRGLGVAVRGRPPADVAGPVAHRRSWSRQAQALAAVGGDLVHHPAPGDEVQRPEALGQLARLGVAEEQRIARRQGDRAADSGPASGPRRRPRWRSGCARRATRGAAADRRRRRPRRRSRRRGRCTRPARAGGRWPGRRPPPAAAPGRGSRRTAPGHTGPSRRSAR